MNLRFLFIGLVAVVASTASAANARGGKAGGEVSSKSLKRRAVYVVPVDPDLVKYSLFTNIEVDVKTAADGSVTFEYTVPVELTGAENKMEFTGAPNTSQGYEMPGASGKAVCDAGAEVGRCQMFYSKLVFDHNLRDSLLTQKANGSADTLQAFKAVAEQFESLVMNGVAPSQPADPANFLQPISIQRFAPVADAADGRPHGILEILK